MEKGLLRQIHGKSCFCTLAYFFCFVSHDMKRASFSYLLLASQKDTTVGNTENTGWTNLYVTKGKKNVFRHSKFITIIGGVLGNQCGT